MKKTNLRINNMFIIEEGKKYFMSSIDDLSEWKELSKNELNKYQEKDISKKLHQLMKNHSIFSNVNFIDTTVKLNGGDKIKTIQIGSSWSKKEGELQNGGGWKLKEFFE